MISVNWDEEFCKRCVSQRPASMESCPACGSDNHPDADYCSQCGSPMAVITRVVKNREGLEKLDPWRVYGVETPLVGRDEELQLLKEALDEVEASSKAKVAIVSGHEGLGKSRFLAEFERQLESSFCRAVILRSICREEVGGAFAAVARMLGSHFYIPEDISPEVARRSLSEAIHVLLGEEDQELVRKVGALMGIHFPDDSRHQEEIGSRREELSSFRAVEKVLLADAVRNPLLFLIDDIHLAPEPTLRLLMHLFEALKEAPVFFVLTRSSGDKKVFPPGTAQIEIELAPLSDTEVRQHIVDTLRLAKSIPEKLVDSVVDAALGNPLVVEEILRMFIAEGIIDTRIEPWRIDQERIDSLHLPSTMEGAVKARLLSLSDYERLALEMASCVGTIFWAELLRSLDGLRLNQKSELSEPWMDRRLHDRRPIDDALESLERKDMIRREPKSRIKGHEEYVFKHRMERETLYELLPPRQRERYHRFIAQWTEREVADISEGAAEFIARHYSRAHCHRRAGEKLLEAGDEAKNHFSNQRALSLYLEALTCFSDADLDLKLRAFHDLGSIQELLGEKDLAIQSFRDMARIAWLLGDPAKGGAALNKLGRSYRALGEYDRALQYFERALALFDKVSDDRGVASTLDDIGKIHWIWGDQKRSMEFYVAALEMRRRLKDKRSIALSLSHLGTLKMQRGELRGAMSNFKEALDLRKASGDRPGTADSYNNLGVLCVEQGKFEKALPLFEEALEIAREVGYRSLYAAVLNNRGEALMHLRRRDEARDALMEARTMAIDVGHQRVLFDTLRNLARHAVTEADRALALQRIEEAMSIASQLEAKSLLATGALTLAELHAEYVFDPELRDPSMEAASKAYKQALTLLEETGNDVQRAHALFSYGNFLLETEETEQGRHYLEIAERIYESFAMTEFLENTRALLGRLEA